MPAPAFECLVLQPVNVLFLVSCFYPQITQIFTDYYLTFCLISVHLRNLRIDTLFSFLEPALATAEGHPIHKIFQIILFLSLQVD